MKDTPMTKHQLTSLSPYIHSTLLSHSLTLDQWFSTRSDSAHGPTTKGTFGLSGDSFGCHYLGYGVTLASKR